MSDSIVMTCGECKEQLDESATIAVEERKPCPFCGSLRRKALVNLQTTVTARADLSFKGKRGGRGRPFIEGKVGASLHRLTGRWNHRERTVDRERDRYTERIVDGETGEVIRHVDEPLSDHRNHGSAKPR